MAQSIKSSKSRVFAVAALSFAALLFMRAHPAVAGGAESSGEHAVEQWQQTGKNVSDLPDATNHLSGTEPPQTPPQIITHEHIPVLSVAGVHLEVPSGAECVQIIEAALRQDQEVQTANDACRAIMRRALEIQRNAPPVEVQQGITEETPPPEPHAQAQPSAGEAEAPVPGAVPFAEPMQKSQ